MVRFLTSQILAKFSASVQEKSGASRPHLSDKHPSRFALRGPLRLECVMHEKSELPVENSALVAATTVARLLGVSPMTLWRRRRAGTIPDPVVVASRNYWRAGVVRKMLTQAGNDSSKVNRRFASSSLRVRHPRQRTLTFCFSSPDPRDFVPRVSAQPDSSTAFLPAHGAPAVRRPLRVQVRWSIDLQGKGPKRRPRLSLEPQKSIFHFRI